MGRSDFGRLSWVLKEPFGAAVSTDLREPMTEAEQLKLRELLFENGVLEFANQSLTMDQQRRFNGYFGPVLSDDQEANPYVSVDPTKGAFGDAELKFHRDFPYTKKPFTALSLHALDVNDGETHTAFANAMVAYRNLPAEMKERLLGLKAVTAAPREPDRRIGRQDIAEPDWPKVSREVAWPHPETGVRLIMTCLQMTVYVEGLDERESEALLQDLYARISAPENVYRHYWNNGDLVIWDNVSCLHARGPLKGITRRTLQRATTAKESFFQAYPGVDLQAMLRYALGDAAKQTKAHAG